MHDHGKKKKKNSKRAQALACRAGAEHSLVRPARGRAVQSSAPCTLLSHSAAAGPAGGSGHHQFVELELEPGAAPWTRQVVFSESSRGGQRPHALGARSGSRLALSPVTHTHLVRSELPLHSTHRRGGVWWLAPHSGSASSGQVVSPRCQIG